ncbi:MAG: galactarate dehydratase, partial [Spirochaetia bacterium]|nr:galactarate dehydratase [Spirochaetia bacterium]
MKPLLITINPSDTVAILTETGRKGEMIGDIILLSDIPQGHKVALKDLDKGDAVLRYGVVLGYLLEDVKQGGWINEHMLVLPEQ